MRTPVAGAVLLALLAFAGCTAAPEGVSTTPADAGAALPAGVRVEFMQQRADVGPREARVMVTNGTDEPLVVTEVAVDDPRFDGPATRAVERTSTIPAGSTTGIRVALPVVACTGAAAPKPTVTLSYEIGDWAGEGTAPLPDPLDFVAPLHERECRAAALAAAADVSFSAFEPSGAGDPATLELTVQPTGEGAATIRQIQPTNLIMFEGSAAASDPFPLDVDVAVGDQTPVVVDVPVVPTRCDPHAVQEDKRGTIFDLAIEVDRAPGEIELFVGEDMRGRILTWVGAWCGFG